MVADGKRELHCTIDYMRLRSRAGRAGEVISPPGYPRWSCSGTWRELRNGIIHLAKDAAAIRAERPAGAARRWARR